MEPPCGSGRVAWASGGAIAWVPSAPGSVSPPRVRFLDFADAAVPGVALAQGIGRWGNWFNNELYGRATDQPWGLVIHQWDQSAGRAVLDAQGTPVVIGTFQPTFLYGFAFVVVLAVVLILLDRRFALRRGQLFGLYIMGYPLSGIFIEDAHRHGRVDSGPAARRVDLDPGVPARGGHLLVDR